MRIWHLLERMNEHAIPGQERVLLIQAREHLGWRQKDLAEKIGTNAGTISRVESGVREPGLALMQRWAKALGPGVSLDIFRTPYAALRKPRGRSRERAA